MASNNETGSRQNLWAGNIAKSMTFEAENVDRRPSLQRGLMNFQPPISSYVTNHLKTTP